MYITQGLHRHLQRCPNATAIRYQGRNITYAEFGDRVARLAGALKRLGVASGDRVAMLSLNSQRYVEYYQAVPWADAVLNPVNIRWSVTEIVYSLDDSQTAFLIVDDNFLGLAGKIVEASKSLRTVIYAGDGPTPEGMLGYEALIVENAPVDDARRGGDSLLGIFYTGGTTGFPKGVMLSHSNVCISSMSFVGAGSCRPDERYLHVMPMYHLADFAAMTALFISGGTHVVLPAFVPQKVLETIATEEVSELLLAPTMIQMLLDYRDKNPEAALFDLSSLQTLGYGASPITPVLLDRARRAFPSAGFRQGYGMTELAPVATILLPEHHSEGDHPGAKTYSAGLPASCVEVRIVDNEDREVARGTVGEIAVRGANVMLGYWNNPQATAEVLRDGWMHTGDGGYMDDDGFIYVCDRLKDMIVSGGENIYSAEVETAISNHAAVAQVAVIGIPCEKWGETVHAVIIRKPDANVTDEEIVAHCREHIAGYKCPRSVEFRDSLPLSSVGKVLKTDLRAPFWEGRKRGVA
ncbi:long-chain-fatty-acid--CoA ligase [Pseudomonas sp. PCH199]|uniref:long-chain-fatty-acid--CoA ligase n=1 Tax=unclassified Pseudomonas TaxID=196821 RepID=UPI000BD34481|nr:MULTISPECIES: long-chain-fatty-acid--CoA ligase [unclassified Pseudomonas]MCW8279205.1 long-chain-fatty-acid--CoA ligase [Pseudomonas sp. PCH199]PAM78529.1 fatty-acid--CoA ligase [Pseudomonas sp. ERMR1:02]